MLNNILRFLGAVACAFAFSFLVDASNLVIFGGTAHFIANLTWTNWLSFDLFRGFLLPVAWGVTWLLGMGLLWLVKGSIVHAVLPIIIFIRGIVNDFYVLFIQTAEPIVEDIGLGFWYYVGASLCFIVMFACYAICTISMFAYQEEKN